MITNLTLRNETAADYRAVEELTREAFWDLYVPGCVEHYVSHILRTHPDFVPELDFVAVLADRIVGNIMYTRATLINESAQAVECLTFGPLCVLPEFQRQGIGSALIRHTREIAAGMGIPAILIHGDPRNYCTHGFKNGKDYNVSDADGRFPYSLLVLELKPGFFSGDRWRYCDTPAFDIDEKAAEQFDRSFPPKKREQQHSQVEFMIACRAYLD